MSQIDQVREAEATAEDQRRIQADLEQREKETPKAQSQGAMQAGARIYPEPPLPRQHVAQPGHETELELKPMYDAPYYKGSDKLKDKVALITGGDSGIGRSVAILFAREGADVAIVYLEEDDDAAITKAAVEREGRRCLLIKGDVSDRAFAFKAVRQVVEAFTELDVLVNNAAFQLHAQPFEVLTPEHFDRTIKTNLYGYFNMAQAAAAIMRPGSAIINTGSVTGIMGSPQLLDYSMTKGGIHAFTRSLSGHLLPKGIRVNCVAPGPVWTPFIPEDRDAEAVSKFGADTPMKRPAQPEELAPAYVFLASPQTGSYITGEILPVIGGYG